MFTPREIKDTEFERVSRGYKVEDVDGFLSRLADQIEQLMNEKVQSDQKLQLLAEKVEQYRKDEDALRSALVNAEKMKESILAEASQQQEIILRDAQQKADKIVADAEGKIDKEEVTLKALKQQVAAFKSEILNIYKAHLEILSDLPDEYMEPAEFDDQSVTDIFAQADSQSAAAGDFSPFSVPEQPAYARPDPAAFAPLDNPVYAQPEPQMSMQDPFMAPAPPMQQEPVNTESAMFEPAAMPANNNLYDGFAPRAEDQPVQPQPAAEDSVFAAFSVDKPADAEENKFGNLDFGENFSFGRD